MAPPPAITFAEACANIIAGTAALGGIGGVIAGSTNFLQSCWSTECFICDEPVMRRGLKEHVLKHRGLVEKCRLCDKIITVHDFEGHMDMHRKEKEDKKGNKQQLAIQMYVQPKMMECRVCGMDVSYQKMERHMTYHGKVLAAVEKGEAHLRDPRYKPKD